MRSKKKILLFIDWYLPGHRAGGPIRSCANLIGHLKDEFDFSVVTRDTDYQTNNPYPGIHSNAWNILPDGTRVYYFSKDQLSRKNIRALIRNEQYDAVYLNGIFSWHFTIVPLQLLRNMSKVKVIVASRGMLADSALAIKKYKKKMFLFFANLMDLYADVLFHVSNIQEADSVKKVFGRNARTHIAPNLAEKNSSSLWFSRVRSGPLKLVCLARIAPEKNIRFALEVLKEVKAEVVYDVYGPVYDEEYMQACRQVVAELPPNVSVNFKGGIESEKVHQTLTQYDFLFLPTLGENFGHAILQSMQAGAPVIISDRTMWSNLEAQNAGWDIALTEKKHFISVTEKCAGITQDYYDVLSRGAYDYALAYANSKESIEMNRQLF